MGATVVQLTESKKQIQHTHRVFDDQKKAFRNNPMPSLTERQENLKRLKRVLLNNQDRLLDAIDRDFSCRSRDESLIAEVMPSIQGINYTLKNLSGWMKPSKRHVSVLFQPASNKVHYQPKGVVGVIVPWNYPLYLAVGPLVASLAAGNRTMIKMSEFTPHTSALFKELIESSFAEDLVSVITGEADVAADFSSRPFDHLLFTGSTSVGKLVMRAASENLTPVTLELGGKSPAIVSPDVPMEDAAQRLAFGKAFNAGQTCVCTNRFLVQDSIYDAFAEKLKAAVEKLKVGNGLDDGVTIGPLINPAAVEKVNEHIADAVQLGARVLLGGKPHALGNNFFTPTILTDVPRQAKIFHEETFGPVAPLIRFNSEAEAIELANDTPFGLASYFYSRDIGRIMRVAEALEYGIVGINEGLISTEVAPFGGVKNSGLGREGSKYGIEDYLEIKYLCLGGLES